MAERHMENLGAAVWRTREERGLTRRALGDQVGATEKTIERWENGSGGLIENLALVGEKLGTNADGLMALAVKIGEERGDSPPAIEPEDRISHLERQMEKLIQMMEGQAVSEAEAALGEDEGQEHPRDEETGD